MKEVVDMAKNNTNNKNWTPPEFEEVPEGAPVVFDDSMEQRHDLQMRMLGGLWGAVVGDALGVPVEFKKRGEVKRDPITGMRGFGTFNLPAGSWSDDSSLLLCTTDSLVHGFDLDDMAARFIRWLTEGLWTPFGSAFDIGNATSQAIARLRRGIGPDKSGGNGEHDNGNGSLMRILPVALFYKRSGIDVLLQGAHAVSSITHRHPRSLVACGMYCIMARFLLEGAGIQEAYKETIGLAPYVYDHDPYARELTRIGRVLGGKLASLKEDDIRSSGYVIDTLEASTWCLLTTGSYEEAVLRAVNLGEDTDTTGCVTGGLAGLYYNKMGIPEKWMSAIARSAEIDTLFNNFIQTGSI
jgi:ADP-ribosyl-[dinitrogen reductase] hydrolase